MILKDRRNTLNIHGYRKTAPNHRSLQVCKGQATSTNSTQLLSRVGLVCLCVMALQLDFLYHSCLIADCLVG